MKRKHKTFYFVSCKSLGYCGRKLGWLDWDYIIENDIKGATSDRVFWYKRKAERELMKLPSGEMLMFFFKNGKRYLRRYYRNET